MKIPNTGCRKALIIVDVQPGFINQANQHIVDRISSLIDKVQYDMYISAVFYAKAGSLWDKQQDWHMPEDIEPVLYPDIAKKLDAHKPIQLVKGTRPAFKGDKDLAKALNENNIKEIHIAGTATHDCVLATAFEAFDLGYPVYVIEEHSEAISHQNRHELGVELLRYQKMTNNSCLAKTTEI